MLRVNLALLLFVYLFLAGKTATTTMPTPVTFGAGTTTARPQPALTTALTTKPWQPLNPNRCSTGFALNVGVAICTGTRVYDTTKWNNACSATTCSSADDATCCKDRPVGPCDVKAPQNGKLGTCSAQLAKNSQCTPTCDTGFQLSGDYLCTEINGKLRLRGGVCYSKPISTTKPLSPCENKHQCQNNSSCIADIVPRLGPYGYPAWYLNYNCKCKTGYSGYWCEVHETEAQTCKTALAATDGHHVCGHGWYDAESDKKCASNVCKLGREDAVDQRTCCKKLVKPSTCEEGFTAGLTICTGTRIQDARTNKSACRGPKCTTSDDKTCCKEIPELCTTAFAEGRNCSDAGSYVNKTDIPTSRCHHGRCYFRGKRSEDRKTCCNRACTVEPPKNGKMGACGHILAQNAICTPACNEGYQLSGDYLCTEMETGANSYLLVRGGWCSRAETTRKPDPNPTSPCENNRCQNNSTCISQNTRSHANYICQCRTGYSGPQCQFHETEAQSCKTALAANPGACGSGWYDAKSDKTCKSNVCRVRDFTSYGGDRETCCKKASTCAEGFAAGLTICTGTRVQAGGYRNKNHCLGEKCTLADDETCCKDSPELCTSAFADGRNCPASDYVNKTNIPTAKCAGKCDFNWDRDITTCCDKRSNCYDTKRKCPGSSWKRARGVPGYNKKCIGKYCDFHEGPDKATCCIESCDITPPVNGTMGTCGAKLAVGSKCAPKCNKGFALVGEYSCEVSYDKWIYPSGARCVHTCDASKPPANGTVGDCPAILKERESCKPTCNSGYVANLSSSRSYCNSDGSFSAATCVKPELCTVAFKDGRNCSTNSGWYINKTNIPSAVCVGKCDFRYHANRSVCCDRRADCYSTSCPTGSTAMESSKYKKCVGKICDYTQGPDKATCCKDNQTCGAGIAALSADVLCGSGKVPHIANKDKLCKSAECKNENDAATCCGAAQTCSQYFKQGEGFNCGPGYHSNLDSNLKCSATTCVLGTKDSADQETCCTKNQTCSAGITTLTAKVFCGDGKIPNAANKDAPCKNAECSNAHDAATCCVVAPSAAPSVAPSAAPSTSPTSTPSAVPSTSPTTTSPTSEPTSAPSAAPSAAPSTSPTSTPSAAPSKSPTSTPSAVPSTSPTTTSPTSQPTTSAPTSQPTAVPTSQPITPLPGQPIVKKYIIEFTITLNVEDNVSSCSGYEDGITSAVRDSLSIPTEIVVNITCPTKEVEYQNKSGRRKLISHSIEAIVSVEATSRKMQFEIEKTVGLSTFTEKLTHSIQKQNGMVKMSAGKTTKPILSTKTEHGPKSNGIYSMSISLISLLVILFL